MLRTLAALAAPALAVMALTGAFYHGDRHSITFPDGWTIKGPDKDGLTTASEPGTTVNCNVQTVDIPDLEKLSLSDISGEYSHVFTAAEWADILGAKPQDLTLVSSDMEPFADTTYHLAVFRLKASETVEATVRYGMYVLPGRVSMVGCYVKTQDYPNYSALVDKTVRSFRPW